MPTKPPIDPAKPRPELGTYVIELTVRELDWPSNGPDPFSSTAEILASYACELEQKINDGYHGRLKVTANRIGIPPNPIKPVNG
jgi:hypothetical protein